MLVQALAFRFGKITVAVGLGVGRCILNRIDPDQKKI
jgi:hypothetical protein